MIIIELLLIGANTCIYRVQAKILKIQLIFEDTITTEGNSFASFRQQKISKLLQLISEALLYVTNR